MPSSKTPPRELEEIEVVRNIDRDDEDERRDDDESEIEIDVFDDELIIEEIQLDDMPTMEGPDA